MSSSRIFVAQFLVSWAVLTLSLRILDEIFSGPGRRSAHEEEESMLLDPLWKWLLVTFPQTTHPSFAGLWGLIVFVVCCCAFTVLDVTHSNTKIQKDWWPTTGDLLKASIPQVAIYFGLNALGWHAGRDAPVVLPAHAPSLCQFLGQMLESFVIGDFLICTLDSPSPPLLPSSPSTIAGAHDFYSTRHLSPTHIPTHIPTHPHLQTGSIESCTPFPF